MKKTFLVIGALFGLTSSYAWQITGAGSTFIEPVMDRWAYDFHKATGNKVNYQGIGSGGGIEQATKRIVDFGASDAPLKPEELKKRGLIQFPDAIGGVVPAINIPGIGNDQLRLDGQTLCGIYMGEIKYWDDPRIKALNPNHKLPHLNITVVHRADGSGTTWIFTNYLTKVCPAWREKIGFSTSVPWPTGIGGKGSEGVTNYVRRIRGAIGYIEYAYLLQNHLPGVVMKNHDGYFVTPTMNHFIASAKKAVWNPSVDFYMELPNAPGKDSWPIEGPTYIIVPNNKPTKNLVAQYFNWVFNNGDRDLESLDYIILPQTLKNEIRVYWKEHGLSW